MTDKKYDWTVIGGGIAGIYAAYRLNASGARVALLEGSNRLGGIMNSVEWMGFHIDNGCHLLDYGDEHSARFFNDMLGADVVPVSVRYNGFTHPTAVSEGIIVPDFQNFPAATRTQMVDEVVKASKALQAAGDEIHLGEALARRYGPTIAEQLKTCVVKTSGYEPSQLSEDALMTLGPVTRVRIEDDAKTEALKASSPRLDEILAVSTQNNPMRFQATRGKYPFRNYYPAGGGMSVLCRRALTFLQERGVDVQLGSSFSKATIESDHVKLAVNETILSEKVYFSLNALVFCNVFNIASDLKKFMLPVSAHFVAFRVKKEAIKPVTFLHDYRETSLSFRNSATGLYSHQIDSDGMSFVIAEINAPIGKPLPGTPDEIARRCWSEMIEQGLVERADAVPAFHIWQAPVAFVLPKFGWRPEAAELDKRSAELSERIIKPSVLLRGKKSLFASVEGLLNVH